MTIYNDGVVVATNTDWTQAITVTIDDPCVLAIEGERHDITFIHLITYTCISTKYLFCVCFITLLMRTYEKFTVREKYSKNVYRSGLFRFLIILPIAFVTGAALEFTMIKWHFNGVNFCESLVFNTLITIELFCWY